LAAAVRVCRAGMAVFEDRGERADECLVLDGRTEEVRAVADLYTIADPATDADEYALPQRTFRADRRVRHHLCLMPDVCPRPDHVTVGDLGSRMNEERSIGQGTISFLSPIRFNGSYTITAFLSGLWAGGVSRWVLMSSSSVEIGRAHV